ncbi:hypothetical protein PC119_g13736 [Phytophthora cactorum]|nr:hypothetical protein PC114_g13862 [Phytophthora cactorum]KAG2931061.1 hypothetical protein PC117_g13569 [Phytophthora cactorum]KAG3009837.1 hypothetical protein PC119_g13736 [Phytophthora cactorum]KAG3153386.1 hypothetical protein C6341_g15965 [Phytophthora cactorum]
MNALDICVFNALQALQLKQTTNNLDGLVYAVTKAFEQLSPATIDKCYITLQNAMQSVIQCAEGSDYQLSRVRKEHIRGAIHASVA